MRQVMQVYLLLLCAAWSAGETLTDEEVKELTELFGTASTDDGLDLTPKKPTQTPTSRQGEISEEEKKRLEALFGTPAPPTPNPLSTNNQGSGNETECDLDGGQKGICVAYYLCKPNSNTINTDGETIIDIRGSFCPHYLDVCCATSERRAEPAPPPPAPAACGWSNTGAHSFRIKGGRDEAEFGEFPWMVALLKRTEGSTAWSQNDFLGGGSIIHPKAVLTVAHKVDGMKANQIKCRAGEYDTQTDKEQYPHQERNVQKIIKHEDFYRPAVYNSIALLILESPYELSGAPHIGVACVAPAPPRAGAPCLGMGWGRDFNLKDQYAVILKKVELPWIPRDKCQTELRKTRLGSHFVLHPSLACAGGKKGRDTCQGDGGSPLVCPLEEPDRYAIFGLVAYGLGCGDEVPGVYVDVPHLRGWLERQTRAEGLGASSYTY